MKLRDKKLKPWTGQAAISHLEALKNHPWLPTLLYYYYKILLLSYSPLKSLKAFSDSSSHWRFFLIAPQTFQIWCLNLGINAVHLSQAVHHIRLHRRQLLQRTFQHDSLSRGHWNIRTSSHGATSVARPIALRYAFYGLYT